MASKLVVLALVFVAIFGLVSAADKAAAPAPADDDAIGNTDDAPAPGAPAGAVAAPVGSVDAAAAAIAASNPGASAPSPNSGAAALGFSAVTGVAAVAGYFVL